MNSSGEKTSERPERKPSAPVIDVTPATNIQSLIVVVMRLVALNFLLRVIINISTPLLVFAGIYPHTADDTPMLIGWGLVGGMIFGAILLWVLALPLARLVARGVPIDLDLGNLSLADCYSLAFVIVGVVYIVSHLADAWNWTTFLVHSTIHGPRYPWNDRTRGYQLVNVFLPFLAGILLIWKRRKWAVRLAGTNAQNSMVSFKDPWGDVKGKASDPISISISPPDNF